MTSNGIKTEANGLVAEPVAKKIKVGPCFRFSLADTTKFSLLRLKNNV